SVVQQLVKAGAISEEEAQVHPYKNVITRCLGMQANVEPDTMELVLQAGDRILMCSDGLSNMVSNQTMQQVVNDNPDPQPACEKLIMLANENGGTDNITVVLLYND
ncbi:MAG TPA: SpoIIE family protein phosphatase, partial [Candidatus Obscuribacterales bacterium]